MTALTPLSRLPSVVAIVLLALVLRTAWLAEIPAGVHADEASNAWSAMCLASAGVDEHQVAWPVRYTRGFNDNRSTLFLYWLAPFQFVGGLSPWAFRLPAALAGTAAVGLLFLVVRRAGGSSGVAAGAAALLAVDPTHVAHTRWAHEASITPTLVLLSIWLAQRAGLCWSVAGRPRVGRAVVAGVVAGVACYGYPSVRLYLPILLVASAVVRIVERRAATPSAARAGSDDSEPLAFERSMGVPPMPRVARARAGRPCYDERCPALDDLNSPRGPRPASRHGWAFLVAFLVILAPLAWAHATDAAMNERARSTWTWADGDGVLVAIGKVAARYAEHFSPMFLFARGTDDPLLASPRPFGPLLWAVAPLLAVGVVAAARTWRTSVASRLAVVALAAYPLGDVLNAAGNANVLRSLCGWWAFALVAAIGGGRVIGWIGGRIGGTDAESKTGRRLAAAAIVGVLAANVAIHLWRVAVRQSSDPEVYVRRGADLADACAFLRPIVRPDDVVAFTTTDARYAYAQVLVGLRYDVESFFTRPRVRGLAGNPDAGGPVPDLLLSVGNLFFLMPVEGQREAIDDAVAASRRRRGLWVVRPHEALPDDRVLHTARLPDGRPSLLVVERSARR